MQIFTNDLKFVAKTSPPILPLEGAIAPSIIPSRTAAAGLAGVGGGRSWAEVPCHETVILPAIKVTSIHYWKWLPTLQTHLGECAVIREFVGEGWGTVEVEGRGWGGSNSELSTTVTRDGKYRERCCRLWPWCVVNWGRWITGEGVGGRGRREARGISAACQDAGVYQ